MIAAVRTMWAFSRPHTIIGSVVSILALYAIICEDRLAAHLPLLLPALVAGIGCNVFIVGINQVADVNIDRINKPYLPVAAGVLSLQQAKTIVFGALLLSLIAAFSISPALFGIVLLSAAIGWAYSMPPFYLKKHHLTAALAIVFVRGILINIGGFLVINYEVNGIIALPGDVKVLSAFIVVFSLVIAWFKDLPDMEGDAAYRISTLAIVSSPRFVFFTGNLLVILVFLLTIFLKYRELPDYYPPPLKTAVLFYGNIFLLLLFVASSLSADLTRQRSVQRYYKRFWGFFFGEYLLYLAAYVL
jgi:homogentisate phytyltransferase / homogentisate geranylgeranyltransferase